MHASTFLQSHALEEQAHHSDKCRQKSQLWVKNIRWAKTLHWQKRLVYGLKLFGKKIIAVEVAMNSEIGINVSFEKHFLSIHNTYPFPAWKTTSHSLAGIPKSYGWPYSELASACVKILPSHSVDEVELSGSQDNGRAAYYSNHQSDTAGAKTDTLMIQDWGWKLSKLSQ